MLIFVPTAKAFVGRLLISDVSGAMGDETARLVKARTRLGENFMMFEMLLRGA